MKKRVRVTVLGRVQGVGFRPTVFRHASDLGLSGFVKNTPEGVVAEAEGEAGAVAAFLDRVARKPPRQALIEHLQTEDIPPGGNGGFQIVPSQRSGDLRVGIPPDLAACEACVGELFDAANRRHRYPFTNCTNCGPRFTILHKLPYDRDNTSMASFKLCAACGAEYVDPADRRFDAQPNACAACGPALRLLASDGAPVAAADPLREAAGLLKRGTIIAIKSLGGYHLCCNAQDDQAVGLLRQRKSRPEKPLAVMFASLEQAARHCEFSDAEAKELQASSAPVVVLKRRADSTLSALVSPDTSDVGAFLPYTPLHHLLLAEVSPLIMTSGNHTEDPIAKDEEELARILSSIADYALAHNRAIVRRCDDSVVRIAAGERTFLRRSRGWVPAHIDLPVGGAPVLACGAELKNTFCLTRDRQAFVSQHIGDLTEYGSYRFLQEAVDDLAALLKIRPAVVAHDMHPDYGSTRFALAYPAERRVAVQHHHAHVAACMVEHGLTGPVIGVALDGAGYGPDGTVWGGEFLVADLRAFRRAGHFKPYRMPGGDEAIRHPARMALSCLRAEFGDEADSLGARLLPSVPDRERALLFRMIDQGAHAPWTSSAGRLFDAASALLGLCDTISYEGQAAVRLQTLAHADVASHYSFEVDSCAKPFVLSFAQMLREVVVDLECGVDKALVAGKFHRTLAVAAAEMCQAIRSMEGYGDVVLSGGVFQNDLLLDLLTRELKARGFRTYSHHLVPANDGGIALGQAAVALASTQVQL
ncbi:MAG: carbamoyltransferase HypF [Verrucomicrobiota bacterium]